MTANRSRPWRVPGFWSAPAGIGLLLLAGLAVWVMPLRFQGVTVDPVTGEGHVATAWDTSRWQAVCAVWWQVLLLGVELTAVLSVTWRGRSWIVAGATATRFFAASLVLHCLLLLSLWGVPLARAVVEHAEVIRVSNAAPPLEDARQTARPAERPAYETVADPPAQAAIRPDVVRQAAPAADMPDLTDPPAPTLPAHAVRGLPPERVLFVPPRQQEVIPQPPEMDRHGEERAMQPAEIGLALPEPPPPEAAPQEKPVEDRAVTQARREATPPAPGGPGSLRLPDLKRPRPGDLGAAAEPPRPHEPAQATDPLEGHRQPGRLMIAAPREPEAAPKAMAAPADGPPAGVLATLPRVVPSPEPAIPSLEDKAEPALPPKQPARVKVQPVQPADATAAAPLPPPRLPRSPARTDREARVEDKVPPRMTYIQRQPEVRKRSVQQYGGTAASEAAVERGLDWLAAHQSPNGSWSLNNFAANCKHPHCADAGTVTSDPAGTGIALLPFLAAGYTHQAGKHRQTVAKALQWLVGQQQPDGTWPAPGDARPMYGHGMASIALCEAYGMTQDAKLREPAQRALAYIVRAQNGPTGAWRYVPNMAADTSVTGWQVMALKSGEMAGLSVPPQTFEGVRRWLASVEGNRPTGGLFGYQSPNPISPAMTAQGLLCLQYLGARRDDPRMRAGTDYLLQHLPQPGAESSYYWYHANQVMYHVQGKHWQAWNAKLRDLLVATQATQGGQAGSWQPTDPRERPGGRLYATALRVLMLEVYYRHLPLYQQLEK